MDTFAHGLATYAIRQSINSRISWRWLVFFGMFPDLCWLPFTLVHLLTSGSISFFNGPYNISHSFVIWLVISALATIRWRKAFLYTWPWALHIFIDMFGHIDMPTPILWPISDWKFQGHFDWLTPPLFIATYLGFSVIFFWLWRAGRLSPKKKTSQ